MIKSLQVGRALAAVSVAAFHLSSMMGQERYGGVRVFWNYVSQGDRGVDFFFVLSGFIILFAHHADINNAGAWGNYSYRRFVRLYPIYWLYTLIFVIVFSNIGGVNAKIPNNFSDWLTSLSLIRFTGVAPPFPVAWSLFHEVAFYTVFSILILNSKFGWGVIGVAVAVALARFQYPSETNSNWVEVYTAAYNLYFIFGMAAYYLYKRGGIGVIETTVGVGIFVAVVVMTSLPERLSSILIVTGLAVTLAGLAKLEASGLFVVPRVWVLVGNASYSIYLTHSNVEGSILKLLIKFQFVDVVGRELAFVVALAGSVMLGCVAYLVIERPLLNLFRRSSVRSYGKLPTSLPFFNKG